MSLREELRDMDNRTAVGRVVVYTLAMLLAALVLGLCVRFFLWAAFG